MSQSKLNSGSCIKNQHKTKISLPVFLSSYCLEHRVVGQLRLFIFWKMTSGGHIKQYHGFFRETYTTLAISRNTFIKLRIWLIKEGWITVNKRKCSYRLASLEQISRKLDLDMKWVVKVSLIDLYNFKAFVIAAVITYWLIRLNGRGMSKRVSVLKWARARKSIPDYLDYNFLPLMYLAKVIKVSKSTAFNYFRLACSAGYISYSSRFIEFEQVDNIGHVFFYRNNNLEGHKLRKVNGRLLKQLPNSVSSHLEIYRRNR